MLRYGLAAALTPDHALQFVESLPDASALQDIDAVIVDAAMLRQGAAAVPIDIRAIEGWQVPTVWIDDGESANVPSRERWLTLTLPVQRERLLKALFDCLNPPTSAAPAAKKSASSAAIAQPRAKKTKPADPPASDGAIVIELVEVVDDEPENS